MTHKHPMSTDMQKVTAMYRLGVHLYVYLENTPGAGFDPPGCVYVRNSARDELRATVPEFAELVRTFGRLSIFGYSIETPGLFVDSAVQQHVRDYLRTPGVYEPHYTASPPP